MMTIDQLYNVMYMRSDPYPSSSKEDAAYDAFMKSLAPLQKENSELYNEIQQKFLKFSDAERRGAFKYGFRTASELMLSTTK